MTSVAFGKSAGVRPIRNAGSPVSGAVIDVRSVTGPASYATGGIPVDLSAAYSSILDVIPTAFVTTATGITSPLRLFQRNQTGTDLFSSGKFRLMALGVGAHTHTYDKTDTPTGIQSSEGPLGAGNHTHSLTFTSTASGATSTDVFREMAAATNLSTFTINFVVIGVPV